MLSHLLCMNHCFSYHTFSFALSFSLEDWPNQSPNALETNEPVFYYSKPQSNFRNLFWKVSLRKKERKAKATFFDLPRDFLKPAASIETDLAKFALPSFAISDWVNCKTKEHLTLLPPFFPEINNVSLYIWWFLLVKGHIKKFRIQYHIWESKPKCIHRVSWASFKHKVEKCQPIGI